MHRGCASIAPHRRRTRPFASLRGGGRMPGVDLTNDSLFAAQADETPAALAAALAPPAAAGHYDELRGVLSSGASTSSPAPSASSPPAEDAAPPTASRLRLPTPEWSGFFETLGREGFADLN